jgi:hypothetical protein
MPQVAVSPGCRLGVCENFLYNRLDPSKEEGGYSSGVQQPWCIQADGDGRAGTSDVLKQLVGRRLPVATDQKVAAEFMPHTT